MRICAKIAQRKNGKVQPALLRVFLALPLSAAIVNPDQVTSQGCRTRVCFCVGRGVSACRALPPSVCSERHTFCPGLDRPLPCRHPVKDPHASVCVMLQAAQPSASAKKKQSKLNKQQQAKEQRKFGVCACCSRG